MNAHPLQHFLLSILIAAVVHPYSNFPPGRQTTSTYPPSNPNGAVPLQTETGYRQSPFYFEVNQGQANPEVRFLAHGSGYSLWLTTDKALVTRQPTTDGKMSAQPAEEHDPMLTLMLVGSNPTPVMVGENRLPGVSNYLIGNDPALWRTNIPHYGRIRYDRIYPGIDLWYGGSQRQLHYDFILAPGSDPARIRMRFEGSESIDLDGSGNLLLYTQNGVIRQPAPLAYQEIGGERVIVPSRFALLSDHLVGFVVSGYNPTRALVIDSVLGYGDYLTGKGSEVGRSITVDASGAVYVAGQTTSSDFPTTSGAFQPAFGSTSDVFVTRFDPTNHSLVYSTYLGGSGADTGYSIKTDGSGAVYITGDTTSIDFPTTPGAYQTTFSGTSDVFVTKLNAAGNALVYSTYLGGTGAETAHSMAIDNHGFVYLTGQTSSVNFPTTPTSYQRTLGGASDVFVTKFDASGKALVYSTYLGGRRAETGYSLKVDNEGTAYITGDTASTNFPTTPGAYQRTLGGASDAFVTKLDVSGSTLAYSTYLGGTGAETAHSIALNGSGTVYVTGDTASGNFPITSDAYQTALRGASDIYITEVNAAGSALIASTYLGGMGADTGYSVVLDSQGLVYITGQTSSTDFPTTSGAYQITFGGGSDAFVVKLKASADGLIYSTYLGGTSEEIGRSITLDSRDTVYVTGDTASTNFPITADAYQTVFWGGSDAVVTAIDLSGHTPAYSTYLGGGE